MCAWCIWQLPHHHIEQENNPFSPEDLAALLASRGYSNLPPQLLPSCRSNSIGDPGDYIQFVLYMRQVLSQPMPPPPAHASSSCTWLLLLHNLCFPRPRLPRLQLTRPQEAERQFRVLSKAQGVATQLDCRNLVNPQRCSLILSTASIGDLCSCVAP
jgi:hypothetical protein